MGTRRAVRQTRRLQHVLVQVFVHGKWFKLQTKDNKVTNAIAMMVNWKEDVELEDDEIHQRIRRKMYGLSR